jgi:cell division transport system permease protein
MRFRLLISEAWKSLGANLSTTFAAVMTVLIGMFLLGLTIALGTWLVSWSDHVKRELVVRVDMMAHVTKTQENSFAKSLQANPYVKSGPKGFQFITKEQGLATMKKNKADAALIQWLPYNPLPDSFVVTPDKPEDLTKLFNSLRNPLAPGVESVHNDRAVSGSILRWAHWLWYTFAVAVAVLLASAALLIANTIRLSIFARRREIEVMKLVGATNWFVRGPFMIEGLLTGAAGALLAIMLLVIGKEAALTSIMKVLKTAPDVHALSGVASAPLSRSTFFHRPAEVRGRPSWPSPRRTPPVPGYVTDL